MSEEKTTVNFGFGPRGLISMLFCLATAVIGMEIHGSVFWAIVDFFFAPLAWLKWVICQEVNVTIIKEAFSWFTK